MNIDREVALMKAMSVGELRRKYCEVFKESTNARNKVWLIKRIAWRMQANAWGDLSERARQRAEELANDSDLRTTAPKARPDDGQVALTTTATVAFRGFGHDARLPMPGAILRRPYKGREVIVRVLPRGFEYEGEVYRTLSAVASAVTGTHWNGYHFFNLKKDGTANE